MKRFVKFIVIGVILSWVTPAIAANKADLRLWKHDPFMYGACGHCADFVRFNENSDAKSFTEFPLYRQTGYYTVHLSGPKGTTVTIYGSKNFGRDRGFLVVVKNDDSAIQIDDLEGFVSGQWLNVPSKRGESGAYSVYYRPFPNFRENLASVNWGQWWDNSPAGIPSK